MKIIKFIVALKLVGLVEFIIGAILLYIGIKLLIRIFRKRKEKK